MWTAFIWLRIQPNGKEGGTSGKPKMNFRVPWKVGNVLSEGIHIFKRKSSTENYYYYYYYYYY